MSLKMHLVHVIHVLVHTFEINICILLQYFKSEIENNIHNIKKYIKNFGNFLNNLCKQFI